MVSPESWPLFLTIKPVHQVDAAASIRETFPVGLLRCNCTLLGDPATGEAIVIDPGLDSDEGASRGPTYLLQRLRTLGLHLQQIIITHAHIDHIGGALALKQATGAAYPDAPADLPQLAMMDMQAAWLGVATPPVVPPDASAEDGLRVGRDWLPGEVLHTPGHTEGSICILFPAAKLLLAGDTLFAGSVGRTDFPGGDSRKLLRSIQHRLLPLPDDLVVIPGHGPETSIGAERESNPFLRELA